MEETLHDEKQSPPAAWKNRLAAIKPKLEDKKVAGTAAGVRRGLCAKAYGRPAGGDCVGLSGKRGGGTGHHQVLDLQRYASAGGFLHGYYIDIC